MPEPTVCALAAFGFEMNCNAQIAIYQKREKDYERQTIHSGLGDPNSRLVDRRLMLLLRAAAAETEMEEEVVEAEVTQRTTAWSAWRTLVRRELMLCNSTIVRTSSGRTATPTMCPMASITTSRAVTTRHWVPLTSAQGINQQDAIVGQDELVGCGLYWDAPNAVPIVLPPLPPYTHSKAWRVNDARIIIGESYNPSPTFGDKTLVAWYVRADGDDRVVGPVPLPFLDG